jgi:hypothetical protein
MDSSNSAAAIGTTIGEALQRSLSEVLSPSSRANAKPRVIHPSVLVAPFGVAQFIQDVQLSCPAASPDRQLAWAMDSLDEVSFAFVSDQSRVQGHRPANLEKLKSVLLRQHPSEDEYYRLWEDTFELMHQNPSSIGGFYTWAAKALRVFSQAKAGSFPVPPSLSNSIILSGLASVPASG